MLSLYGFVGSRAVRVAWALEEVGVQWSFVGTHPHAPEYLAINPFGKVPALVDGDLVLTESAACCLYVADRRPEAGLAPPPATAARAQHDRWCIFAMCELEQPPWMLEKHTSLFPSELRAPEAVLPGLRYDFGRAVGALEAELGDRHHLVGDRFTVADLLASTVIRWARLSFDVPDVVSAYAERHLARPALARATERCR